MGRLARVELALLRQRAEQVHRNNVRIKARNDARSERAADQHRRDDRALAAHNKWANSARNQHLSSRRRSILPVRLYKKDGFNTAEIAVLRDPHRTAAPLQRGSTIWDKLAYIVCTTITIFYGLLIPASYAFGGSAMDRPFTDYAWVDVFALIALATAVKTADLHFSDFEPSVWYYDLLSPIPIKGNPGLEAANQAKDSDFDDVSSGSGSRRGIKRRAGDDGSERESRKLREKKSVGQGGGEDGSDGDDSWVPEQPPSKTSAQPKKKALSKRRTASLLSSESGQDEASKVDLETAEFASELLQANDFTLRNTLRVAKHLKEARLTRTVLPVMPEEENEISIAQSMQRRKVPGRNVQPLRTRQVSSGGRQAWVFLFTDGNAPKRVEMPKTSIQVGGEVFPMNSSPSEVEQLHDELTRMYNAWPYDFGGLDGQLKYQWVAIALSNLVSRAPQVIQATNSEAAGLVYRTMIKYINSATGQKAQFPISATGTDAAMADVTIPRTVMNVYRLEKPPEVTQTGTSYDPTSRHYLPAASTKKLPKTQTTSVAAQHTAQDALYWLQLQLQGLITTEARMQELVTMHREQIGLQAHAATKRGLFGREGDLYNFRMERSSLSTLVTPALRVAEVMGHSITTYGRLSLKVYSLNASRATPVMDTIIQLFCNGRDIRQVWIEAARTADFVNADIAAGVPPYSRCDCDDSATGSERHACEGCAKAIICNTRSYDSLGRLVCNRCYTRDLNQVRGNRVPGESHVAYLTRRSLWRSFRRECAQRALDVSQDQVKSIFNAAWKGLKASLPGQGKVSALPTTQLTTYVDEYSRLTFDMGEERPLIGGNPSRRRFVPSGLTVDAIHRQGSPEYENLKHSPDNVAVTSNGCNFGKSVFLVGILQEIGNYIRNGDRSHAAKKALVTCIQAMTLVNLKRPFINKGQGTLAQKYAKIKAESMCGKVTEGEHGPWEASAKRIFHGNQERAPQYNASRGNSIWPNSDWKKLQACAQSIARFFDVELFRLTDGTLWIGADYSNPASLDRNDIAVLLKERLNRMRLVCNKKWQTSDNEYTLYAEIIFQYCASMTEKAELQKYREKYGDRFGLPLVLWLNNPLRFSIAHREHGFGMFTGWTSTVPVDVQERLDNDERNNMLIETWFVNSAKLDMAEEYYPELDRILQNVQIDEQHYDPSARAAKGGPTPWKLDMEVLDIYDDSAFDQDADDEEGADPSSSAGPPLTSSTSEEAGNVMDLDPDSSSAQGQGTAGQSHNFQIELGAVMQELIHSGKADLLVSSPECRRALARLQDVADTDDEDTGRKWGEQMAVWGTLVYGEE